MRTSFAHNKAPMVVGVIKERTPQAAILKIREGEFAGARGFDLHITQLDEKYWNVSSLREIVSCTNKPILALNYNNGYDKELSLTDDERMQTLIDAAEAGASAVDIQGYTFDKETKNNFIDDDYIPEGMEFLKDKRPNEVALKPGVIKKQTEFIEKIHSMGAEVLGSVHLGTILNKFELEKIARFVRSKGADVVKIVGTCTDKYQVPDAIEATMHLNDTLDFPFSYHLNGKEGIITRKLCPLFGSYISFCNVDYTGNADSEQLHVRSIIDAYRALGEL